MELVEMKSAPIVWSIAAMRLLQLKIRLVRPLDLFGQLN
jgi:hypothetical protein